MTESNMGSEKQSFEQTNQMFEKPTKNFLTIKRDAILKTLNNSLRNLS